MQFQLLILTRMWIRTIAFGDNVKSSFVPLLGYTMRIPTIITPYLAKDTEKGCLDVRTSNFANKNRTQ